MRLFCFGMGYTGMRLAETWQAAGGHATGTTRDGRAGSFRFDGSSPLDDEGKAALRAATHILVTVPPDTSGDIALRHHAADMADARWIGYLSTTGVYGDWQGEWVDESSPLRATEPRLQRRILAERQWAETYPHSITFRLAGIYGPGRNALCDLRRGNARSIIKPGQYFSRIHVEDIVRLVSATMDRPAPHKLYNLADFMPAPSHEVVAEAARLLHLPAPPEEPFDTAQLSPMAAGFYAANRRVNASRILRDFTMQLCYPTYKEGLLSLLTVDGICR